jgi:hypothetical protein
MNVYEDKYLREKVNRTIARQNEGKIVIAAYKVVMNGEILHFGIQRII